MLANEHKVFCILNWFLKGSNDDLWSRIEDENGHIVEVRIDAFTRKSIDIKKGVNDAKYMTSFMPKL